MKKDSAWLKGVLNANGFTPADLQQQTGITDEQLHALLHDEAVSKDVWNIVLTQINDYPAIDYPSAQILSQLQSDIQQQGADAECIVYYGVNAGDLIFCDYTFPGSLEEHGANVNLNMLASLQITLQEALQLFTKQNCTLA